VRKEDSVLKAPTKAIQLPASGTSVEWYKWPGVGQIQVIFTKQGKKKRGQYGKRSESCYTTWKKVGIPKGKKC